MGIWQAVENEFHCDHPESEIRLKYDSLNRPQYFKQCLTCGQPCNGIEGQIMLYNSGNTWYNIPTNQARFSPNRQY